MLKAFIVGIPAGIAGWYFAGVFVLLAAQSPCQAAGTCPPLTGTTSPIPILVGLGVFALVMVAGWFLTRPISPPSEEPRA